MHDCIQCGECNAHVGRVRRDALRRRAKDGVDAVKATDRVAPLCPSGSRAMIVHAVSTLPGQTLKGKSPRSALVGVVRRARALRFNMELLSEAHIGKKSRCRPTRTLRPDFRWSRQLAKSDAAGLAWWRSLLSLPQPRPAWLSGVSISA